MFVMYYVYVVPRSSLLIGSTDSMIIIIQVSITREMQSINGASLRVLDSSIERIVLKTFES